MQQRTGAYEQYQYMHNEHLRYETKQADASTKP